jgi:3-hydroxyisobutyrate dehydrogenase-like beta-hydroxyacid dehydrogenase
MRFGYLGVGNMGRPMAGKLLDAGHELCVYDVSEDAMRPLLSVRRVRRSHQESWRIHATRSLSLCRRLRFFGARFLDPTDCSLERLSRHWSTPARLAGRSSVRSRQNAPRQMSFVIDAPISGGVVGAEAGTLAVMVSGNPSKIAELMPMFQLWGKAIVVAGDRPGAAQTMKLTNNILCAVALVATSEAMTMSGKAGIPADAMLQILNNGTGRNFATTHIFPNAVLPGTFDFGATIEILMKDVDLAIALGEELGVPMWVCQAVRLVLKHGVFQGRAQQDMSRVVQIVEDGTRTK